MRCLYCDKEISNKAKYCSEAHSKAYRRRTQTGQLPGQNDPDMDPDSRKVSDLKLTRTDSMFDKFKPGYYKFSENVKSEKCLQCGKEFKTSLTLLKQCSPQCMREMLDSLSV